MNTIVNITGLTLNLSNKKEEKDILKAKKRKLNKKWYLKNREKKLEKNKKWYEKNKNEISKKRKEWYLKNKEKKLERNKKWYEKNKNYIRKKNKKRRKTDFSYKLIINLRRRTLLALKGKCKSSNTMKLLGINNIEELWLHLEKQFKPGMTRKNHGFWHIDHRIPCSSFDLTKPEEQAKCFHYTNLQPLWASENLAKGSKIS